MLRRVVPTILIVTLALALTGATHAAPGDRTSDTGRSAHRAAPAGDAFMRFLLEHAGLAWRLTGQRGLAIFGPGPTFGTNGLSDGPDPVGDSAEGEYGGGHPPGSGSGQPENGSSGLPLDGAGYVIELSTGDERAQPFRRYGDQP